MFELGKYLAALAFPPGIILLLGLAAVFLAFLRKRRPSIFIASFACLSLYLLSIAPIADALLAPLEDRYPPFNGKAVAGAIVVLGGGCVLNSPEYGGHSALVDAGLTRAAYGARLSRLLDLPIIYSGGAPLRKEGTDTEAEAARRFYEGIGFEPGMLRIETKSRDTAENASLVSDMAGDRRVILVTSAFHMPRSVLSFEKAGMEPIPAPTDYRRDREAYRLLDFFPSAGSLGKSTLALHEYVGLAYYSMTM